jgi:hypothetical protein
VNAALEQGAISEALQQAARVFSRLGEPAAWLVDFARVFYHAALTGIGGNTAALKVPPVTITAGWKDRMHQALACGADADRALALATLAEQMHPPSMGQAKALVDRTRVLKRQIAASQALVKAGQLLGERQFEATLHYLNDLNAPLSLEPRFLRIRVLALFGLDRFDEADALIAQSGSGSSPEIREFIANYPSLAFRQRIAGAHRLLRDAKPQEALAILHGAAPTSDKDSSDLAYCRAFALSLEGYQLRRQTRTAEARSRFSAALAAIEPVMRSNKKNGHQQHIADLYERIEKEVES